MTGTGIITIVDLGAGAENERVVDLDTMKTIVQIIKILVKLGFILKIHDLEIGDQFMKEEDIQDLGQEKINTETIGGDVADREATKGIMLNREDTAVLGADPEVEKLEMTFIPEDLEQTLIRRSF